MRRSLGVLLVDIENAILDIEQFTQGKAWPDYQGNKMLRYAVERQFILIGEALSRIRTYFPDRQQRLEDARKIINFRNFLIHEYEDIDDGMVWAIIQKYLSPFKQYIAEWIREIEGQ